MSPITYEEVYFVQSSQTESVNPIAIRPTILPQKHIIQWEDTSRGTTQPYTKLHIEPEQLEVNTSPEIIKIVTPSEEITLTKLSLDLFNRHVKDWVAGRPTFHSDEELRNYYLTTEFQMM